jgi:hypothetical protein
MNHEVEITTCRELLGLYPPEEAPKNTIKVAQVNFDEFDQLQGGGRELIRSFFVRARSQSQCQPQDSFEPFIFGWIALNSWASCVTGVDNGDTPYLNALMLDRELKQRFGRLLDADEFKDHLKHFGEFWPILRPLPHSRISTQAESRQQRIYRELDRYRSGRPAFRPACAARHHRRGEKIPMDWPHTLAAIYQVRCNLFHGSKSLHSDIDTQIVFNSFRVLVRVLSMLGM